ITAACVGIAGPVVDGRAVTPNLPWVVDERRLAAAIPAPRVRLLNDLEATAHGIWALGEDELVSLQPGALRSGNLAVIAAGTGLGVDGADRLCAMALALFVSVYGAEAGNLALKALAVGGVILAGGIAPRILPALRAGSFVAAFRDKGRLASLMETIPVFVTLNPKTALLGAARV